ncbi:adhesin [Guyparkeria halophila]|uniref:Adhesin n=1 Tax=Guyparkeria halophila TaxID=47960 RepID=A0A6I6CVN8_9GAMM|nr:adhesin [Guyparkeria halophila]QGT78476.1 adhesin [Guyparkeria halophila]
MKTQLKMTLIASAVAALVSGPVMASESNGEHEGGHHNIHMKVKIDVDKNIDVDKTVDVEKNLTLNKTRNEIDHVDRELRDIVINASAGASAHDRQFIHANDVRNKKLTNNASIGDNVGNGASGNIGMNVAAGDTNVQDNAAALAAVDAGFVFGESYASVDVDQTNLANTTRNSGVMNNASIGQSAFANASGNIGVNVAAGTGNGQKNTMAASVSTARVANATLSSNQESIGNSIRNEGRTEKYTDSTQVQLAGYSFGGYYGGGHGGYSGTTSGTIDGEMDQMGNVYPDIWTGSSHPAGSADGHFDLDTATQGGSDLNDDGGALAFGTHDMTYEGEESGRLGFREGGKILLGSVMSGEVATTRYVVVNAKNDASLLGNAFANASGNIGVNVASGTGNLQSNALSMAVACNTCAGGTGE